MLKDNFIRDLERIYMIGSELNAMKMIARDVPSSLNQSYEKIRDNLHRQYIEIKDRLVQDIFCHEDDI